MMWQLQGKSLNALNIFLQIILVLQIHLWILHLICKIQKLDIGTSARILLIDRQKCAQFYGIGFNKTMYKMLNYRKKTAAASLAGLNLERPIQVRTIFCYIFHFSCRSRKNSQPLWHSVASQKKLRMHLELGHLALRRTESCSLAIRVKNALKKKVNVQTYKKKKTVNSKTQHDESVIVSAVFFPISLICVCGAQMCAAFPMAPSQKSNSWKGRPTAHWSAVAK